VNGAARIFLVDDHDLVRAGLSAILQTAGFQVVGETENGRAAVEAIPNIKPDVVLMDITMPELNGIDATRRLLLAGPQLKVIALSMNSDRRSIIHMFQAGASGYLLKTSAPEELLTAVRAVVAGHKYVSPKIAGVLVGALAHGSDELGLGAPSSARALTIREREILQLVAEGKTSKEIGDRMNIAVATVETHRRQIMDKLGLRTIAELTKYAIREGLTSLE